MQSAHRRHEVVVTGLGVVSPIGVGKQAFWSALCAGRSGIKADATTPSRLSAAVDAFSARELIHSPNLRRADALSRMIVASARMAIDDAGLDLAGVPPERIGVVVGSALGAVADSVQYLEKLFSKGPALASPMLFPNLVLNAAASYVAMEIGATGANFTVGDGEICGEQALALALATIRAGRADVVVAGGGDDFLPALVEQTYRSFHALAGQRGGVAWCSPYDRDRSGVVLGQGAAMLVLESAAHARRRTTHAYAALRESLSLSLSSSPFAWPKDGTAAVPLLQRFLAAQPGRAGVDLVLGNANSSRRLDACLLALSERLPARDGGPWVSSIKGAIGEFGAAGALSMAAACLALHEGIVPPLCNLRHPDSNGRLRFAAPTAQAASIERVLSLGIARGGAATALLLERAQSVSE